MQAKFNFQTKLKAAEEITASSSVFPRSPLGSLTGTTIPPFTVPETDPSATVLAEKLLPNNGHRPDLPIRKLRHPRPILSLYPRRELPSPLPVKTAKLAERRSCPAAKISRLTSSGNRSLNLSPLSPLEAATTAAQSPVDRELIGILFTDPDLACLL
ncbi:hypothetical protein M5K25_017870 [Dendrobium thyrsiflorum]|uniref:Uncharacterized protein n=1 Tax=Dendrobium thyrsiflorum TaxID=117978 RepID=A0ABD0UNE5_DENTH